MLTLGIDLSSMPPGPACSILWSQRPQGMVTAFVNSVEYRRDSGHEPAAGVGIPRLHSASSRPQTTFDSLRQFFACTLRPFVLLSRPKILPKGTGFPLNSLLGTQDMKHRAGPPRGLRIRTPSVPALNSVGRAEVYLFSLSV